MGLIPSKSDLKLEMFVLRACKGEVKAGTIQLSLQMLTEKLMFCALEYSGLLKYPWYIINVNLYNTHSIKSAQRRELINQ